MAPVLALALDCIEMDGEIDDDKAGVGEFAKDSVRSRRFGYALSTKELAAHVMAERGLNTADERLVMLIGKRVGACLRMHRNKGIVKSKQGPDNYLVWEIA